MRYQLQLALDHRPSFKASAELVLVTDNHRRIPEVYLRGYVFDGRRPVPVVFLTTRDLAVGTAFLSCFNKVEHLGACPASWLSSRRSGL